MCMQKYKIPISNICLSHIAFIEECFNNYPDAANRILVFDKYEDISAKDHERMRQASKSVIDYDLAIASHLDKSNYEKQIQ